MLDLTTIFQFQDAAFSENLERSEFAKEMFGPLCRSVRLSCEVLLSMQFDAKKQTVIRRLGVMTLSHLAVATRIGFWGALPESLCVLRGAVESSTQLLFTVQERLYQTAIFEMDSGKLTRVEFGASCRGLGSLGQRIRRHHGIISEIASHSTSSRALLCDYEIGGRPFDRLGFAASPPDTERVLYFCADPCLVLSQSFRLAYLEENLIFPWEREFSLVDEVLAEVRSGFDGGDDKMAQHAG